MSSLIKKMNIADLKGQINNILVIRRNNIGDMICALPVLKTLRKEYPQARITVLAEAVNSIILKDAPFIDDLIIYKKGSGIFKNKYLNFWRLFRENKTQFDLAIVLKAGFSSASALMTIISGARYRQGCIPDAWHPLQLCYNLPVKVQDYWHPNHIKDIFLEMIKPLGKDKRVRDISFDIPDESKARVAGFFRKNNVRETENIIVINISNNRPDTRWPVERYKETSELISKEYNAVFIITSIPSDKASAMRLSQSLDNAVYFDEVDKIMDFAALVDESDLLICGEGGSMHIGASVNIPTISLWGGTASVANWMHRDLKQFMLKKGKHVDSISPLDILSVIKENELLK